MPWRYSTTFMNYVAWQTNLALIKFVRLFQNCWNVLNELFDGFMSLSNHSCQYANHMRVEQMLPIAGTWSKYDEENSWSLNWKPAEKNEQLLPQFAESIDDAKTLMMPRQLRMLRYDSYATADTLRVINDLSII